ncbi:MAG TPA: class D sortase [Candidatus Polarisedimenticolia bacterium]|nr:class D sortase [Candidatus Polarisedimenticolia bacterium]
MKRPRGSWLGVAGPLSIAGRPVGTMEGSTVQRLLAIGLLLTGLTFLGAWTWEQLDTRWFQATQNRRLAELQQSRSSSPHGTKTSASSATRAKEPPADNVPPHTGDLIGKIDIGRVGLSAIIAEGTDSRTLRRAVGHVPSTPLPGDEGNVVLAGHRDSFFRALRTVEEGDEIDLTTPDATLRYEITSIEVVGAEDTDVLWPTKEKSLTLITCYPFHYLGPAPDRFVVRARQLD